MRVVAGLNFSPGQGFLDPRYRCIQAPTLCFGMLNPKARLRAGLPDALLLETLKKLLSHTQAG